MRRRLACLLFSVLALCACAPAQLKVATPTELGVVKVLVQQEAAWNRGDIEGFASGYKNSPDTLFIGSHVLARAR